LFSQARAATTYTVTSAADAGGTCPGATCTLRQAIVTAATGDTINFSAGIITISLTSAELLINKNLTISGPGANLLSIERSPFAGNFGIFIIPANITATISGLTITNGNVPSGFGGGIQNLGILTLSNSTVSGNNAGSGGGGIQNNGNLLTINKSTISGNMSGSGGGIHNTSTVTITNSTISGNMATSGNGGGIYSSFSATITNSTIAYNSASGNGGGIYRVGTVNARNTIIAQNIATIGFDVYGELNSQGYNLIRNTSDMTIVGTTTGNQTGVDPLLGPLQDNDGPTKTHALSGSPASPAIDKGHSSGSNTDQRGFLRPVDSPTISPSSGGDGSDIGAYEVQADVLPGCDTINRIVNNNNDSGTDSLRAVIANVCAGSVITFSPIVTGAINLTSGELAINKSLTINGPGASLLSVQRSSANGTPNFRIFNITSSTANVAISGLTIANGNVVSVSFGGGIYNTGTLTLTNATISGNSAGFGGGGIYDDFGSTLTINGSTISGNSGTGGGAGGILNNGTLNLINSTLSGNMATGGNGGAVAGGTVVLINSTISGNSAGSNGGGIFQNGMNGGSVKSRNTIIALNTAPAAPDVYGALTSEGFSLIGKNTSGFTSATGDQYGSVASPLDPMLDTLQDHGGPTFTHALLFGSPAIDQGNASGSFTDQRDFARPADQLNINNAPGGDGSDIGAYEFGSLPLHVTSAMRSGNNMVVGFEGIQGKTYRLERKLAIEITNPSWQAIGDSTPYANGFVAIADHGAFNLGKAFYRVRLLP
jgi:CSLREA domain-containing protein